MPQGRSGVTPQSGQRFILDAGEAFINIDIEALETVGEDPVGNAIAAAIKLGATRGGSSFNPGRTLRQIPLDGTLGPTKGFVRRGQSAPTLTVNIIEMTVDNFEKAIAGLISETKGAFTRITGGAISDATYVDNIALVTTFTGSTTPIVLVLHNVLALEAPVVNLQDEDEVVMAVTFTGHVDPASPGDEVWAIYHPGEDEAGS
jgi:hypothetical protein